MAAESRPSLKSFDAHADRNGQDVGGDSPLDVGLPSRTRHDLKRDPGGEAETARLASGLKGEDATDATEAETPPENLRHIGDATSGTARSPSEATREALDRATAGLGTPSDGKDG